MRINVQLFRKDKNRKILETTQFLISTSARTKELLKSVFQEEEGLLGYKALESVVDTLQWEVNNCGEEAKEVQYILDNMMYFMAGLPRLNNQKSYKFNYKL